VCCATDRSGSKGFESTPGQTGAPYNLLASVNTDLPIDAAILFKNTGAQLAIWTRTPVAPDVVSVMASTLLASTEVLLENFGDVHPASFVVETDRRCILFDRVDSQVILALVAPISVSRVQLREEAERLADAVRGAETATSPRSTDPAKVRKAPTQ